jgi:hypothetical protein
MSDKNTPPFQKGDIVRYTRTILIGKERTVDHCTKVYGNEWSVWFDNGFMGEANNLELVQTGLGTMIPSEKVTSAKVDGWSIGYCDNETHWRTEHPLYTSSDNGCKNFVTSERLIEIKQLFDLTEENENLIYERDQALNDIEILLQERLKQLEIKQLRMREKNLK